MNVDLHATTGLHPSDTMKLMAIINELIGRQHTLIVIEHNLDIILRGAGKDGGHVVLERTLLI